MHRNPAEQGHPVQFVSSFEGRQFQTDVSRRRIRIVVLALTAVIGIGAVVAGLNYSIDQTGDNKDQKTIAAWTQEVTLQLQGRVPLHSDQRFYDQVQVVAAGQTLDERIILEKNKTPIEVTSYPSYVPSGRKPPVIGTVDQGTHIAHVLAGTSEVLRTAKGPLSTEYGAVFCSDLQGPLHKTDDQQSTSPKDICVIDLNNLQRVK